MQVIDSGEPLLATNIAADALSAYAHDSEHLAMLEAIAPRSVVIVPIAGPTRALGAITLLSSAESERQLTQADVDLAVRLGRRAGTAVENSRLYTERSRIAQTLQRALLPEALPEVPHVELAASYSAAGELNEVGGDFYDVFACEDESWILVIGDVCGKGAHAAGLTAMARHTLRAAASNGQTPTSMLETLNRAFFREPGQTLCTVCLVKLAPSPGRAQLTVTLAGHPAPLLIGRRGEVTPVGQHGMMLGVTESTNVTETLAAIDGGQALLLYTDGVTEAGRGTGELGEQGLSAICGEASTGELADLLHTIEAAAKARSGGALRDDLALLVARSRLA
jgi:serine phosphatase RsbU (regulator of sigma subunit)